MVPDAPPNQDANGVKFGIQNGRDHNPHGFTMWLAGGVKGGMTYSAKDDFGFNKRDSRFDEGGPRTKNWMAGLDEDDRVVTCTIVRGEVLFASVKLARLTAQPSIG